MKCWPVTLVAVVLGCSHQPASVKEPEDLDPDTDYAVTIVPETSEVRTGAYLTFLVTNNGEAYLTFSFCDNSALEVLVAGRWSAASEPPLVCPSIGFALAPGGGSQSLGRPMRVSPGRYRLRVDLYRLAGPGPDIVIRRSTEFQVVE